MAEYGAFRFGRDAPPRIATTTTMLVEPFAVLPGEPMYQPIPFLPSITSGSGGALGSGSSDSDIDVWSNAPGRCDLMWYQGDDVVVPLTIEDPSDVTPDMSTAWEWSAQIRVLHTYHSTLVNTFSVTDEYTAPVGETPGYTTVNLFLPRSENVFVGRYRWDLYSKSPLDVAGFPDPLTCRSQSLGLPPISFERGCTASSRSSLG